MQIDPALVPSRDVYLHMISLITPRPIAWVSTLGPDGQVNLAPYSFFTGITSRPPTLVFCAGNREPGVAKDSAAHAIAQGEFVVNVVPYELAQTMVQTSGDYPVEVSEFEAVGLAPAPSAVVAPPRVAESPAQFECRVHQVVPIEDDDGSVNSRLIIGRVVQIHVNDEVLGEKGFADPSKLDSVGRLGGRFYSRTQALFSLDRPKV